MDRLELTVGPGQAGRAVGSLMRRELAMAEGLISKSPQGESTVCMCRSALYLFSSIYGLASGCYQLLSRL